ncbi:uncharacterized protein LOC126736620 isoform X2 [Anthonomus grandis grandis]|uniref:uncharacterized protein LOC126736620 isoform X2 n=1 Tax=Anthonomus grandis grandis TaxID=2921223 RepID=UPI002166ACD4|nr:uncharacterized protein LOC126736620 isoform X2 [Anthonomus grandis grandis]
MEEEDELELTQKGKLIKVLEEKIKKPEIDDTLKKVLDEYNEITRKETPFLDNGVLERLNFAEDALVIQACGQYYGKCVDKLWDELLQLHTRMVKYDEVTAKNCTDRKKQEERQEEISRLEERLNRGKRKKIVLSKPDEQLPPKNGQRLIDFQMNNDDRIELFSKCTLERHQKIAAARDKEEIDFERPFDFNAVYEIPIVPFEADDVNGFWNQIYQDQLRELQRNYNSIIVIQYHKLRNRFKHHLRLNMEDEVYDMDEPEELNTRIGRLISYQHIINDFEDNDKCLLPDDNLTLAKLRLAVYARKNWMLKNNITMYTPYEDYRERWLQFRKEFFDRERRKIQNMPQNSCEETILFFKALAKKEQIARQKIAELKAQGIPAKELPSINFYDIIIMPARDDYVGPLDPFIPEGFDLPPPPPIDLTESETEVSQELSAVPAVEGDQGDHEPEISTLLENEPEHPDPNAQEGDKLRSDSGYFDGGFEDEESNSATNNNNQCDTPLEFDKEHVDNIDKATTDSTEPGNPTGSSESENLTGITNPDNPTGSAELENPTGSPEPSNPEEESASVENQSAFDENLTELDTSSDVIKDSSNFSEEIADSLPEYDSEKMNAQIKEFSQQALIEPEAIYDALEGSYFHQDGDIITIVYNKPTVREEENVEGDFIKLFGNDVEYETVYPENYRRKRKLEDSELEQKVETRRRLLLSCENSEPLKKIKKLSSKQVEKLKMSLIPAVKEPKWDHFYSLNYQTESGEGEIVQLDYESDNDEANEDNQLDNDNDQAENNEVTDLNVSGYHSDDNENPHSENDSPLPASQDSGVNIDATIEEIHVVRCQSERVPQLTQPAEFADILPKIIPQGDSELQTAEDIEAAAVLERLSDPAQIEDVIREREELLKNQREEEWSLMSPQARERELMKKRVAEWTQQMNQKLKNVKEQDFDIHQYGSTIMESLTKEQPKPFSEFVEGQSSSEVVRFFVSSLQLANTMNVELCGVKQGELSNDTLAIKLLSKERYHDHLQEYQAPSEETLRERLKRARADLKNRAKEQNPPSTDSAMIQENNNEDRPRQRGKRDQKRQKTMSLPHNNNNDEFVRPKLLRRPRAQVPELSDEDEDQPLQVYKHKMVNQCQQPCSSKQADMKDLEILTEQCLKRKSTSKKAHDASPIASPTGPSPHKVRILNFSICQRSQEELNVVGFHEFEETQPLPSGNDDQNVVEMALSEIAETPNRSSTDSGFIPSCDEDFLEQFDHFQQINEMNVQSTPVKQRKQIRIKVVKMNTNSQ